MHKGSFTSSFPMWMPFVSFSCLNQLTRASGAAKNSSESGHPYLVPDPRWSGASYSKYDVSSGVCGGPLTEGGSPLLFPFNS